MKKSILLILVLLLLLTACQGAPVSTSSSGLTPPSSSVTPPTSSAPPTVPPTTPTTKPTEPSYDIYDGDTWLSGSRLSWKVYDPYYQKYKYILISDDTRYYVRDDTNIYFVKQAEPTNIYVVSIGDFSNHQLFYESTYGNITYMHNGKVEPLQFVADNKKFVTIDVTTGESTLLMEMYYISWASIWGGLITFEGRPDEMTLGGLFEYNPITGVLERDNSL